MNKNRQIASVISLADISSKRRLSSSQNDQSNGDLRQSRPYSLLITPFSAQEWVLANSITMLMDHITAYPDNPDFVPTEAGQNVRHLIVHKASDVVKSVSNLSQSCLESVKMSIQSNVTDDGASADDETQFREKKQQLHSCVIMAVDKIKQFIVNDTLQDEVAKQLILEYLIDIASMASELIDFATDLQRVAKKMSGLCILPDTLIPSQSDSANIQQKENRINNNGNNGDDDCQEFDADDESEGDNDDDTEIIVKLDPDGESFCRVVLPDSAHSVNFKVQMNCSGCKQKLSSKVSQVEYKSRRFHLDCFRCVSCHGVIKHQNFLTHSEQPLCSKCSPQCHGCQKPIVADCFLALDKTFHVQCFKCISCLHVIPVDAQFYRKSSGACCVDCMHDTAQKKVPQLDKRKSVFEQLWNPTLNTRFSLYLDQTFKPGVESKFYSGSETSFDTFKSRRSTLDMTDQTKESPVPPPRLQIPQQRSFDPMPTPPQRKESVEQLLRSPSLDGLKSFAAFKQGPQLENVRSHSSVQQQQTAASSNLTVSPAGLVQDRISIQKLMSMPGVLSSEFGVQCFVDFCMDEDYAQQLFFWMDVEQFRTLAESQSKDANRYAQSMFAKYIKRGAEMCLHELGGDIVRQISADITKDNVPPLIFDVAQKQIYGTLSQQALPRFLKSKHGNKYLQKIVQKQVEQMPGIYKQMGQERAQKYELPKMPPPEIIEKYPDYLVKVSVIGFEKRYSPEKHYVYQLHVGRIRDIFTASHGPDILQDGKKFCPVIYRTLQEILDVHRALVRYFPKLKDKFPQMVNVKAQANAIHHLFKHSNNKDSKDRTVDLDQFFFQLFKMPSAVVQSVIMKEFIKPTKSDIETYHFDLKIMPKS
ncbi:hypothetical protein MP228_010871 [Amoeboaphelidium protococcarum]|nr:hypothetical protein MP228_010871 [Amoeboaphelidium protococcarum]